MSNTVKLQIPIDKTIRDKLAKRAASLGFDSVQAYIRVWAKAEADGRQLNFDYGDWGEPSLEAQERWERQLAEHEKLRQAGKVRSYTSVEDFLADLKA